MESDLKGANCNSIMYYKLVICTLLWNMLEAEALPQAAPSILNAVDSFQNAVQQQTFQSVLLAIEERLRNLDNIYSIQLSETLKSKLDQYHRKLESLDIKIIRLESLVMLNLNKISENISSKNYKDDVAQSQIYRKLDSMYDGLGHRINYMDRKSDMAFEKLQNKIDTTLLRIEKMEENMMQRNSDIEAELSETLFVIEDIKTSSESTEQSLINITNILNQTGSSGPLMNSINLSMQNLIRDLNQSFIQSLENLGNTSSRNLNVSEESNNFLKSIKLELKEDFNEYANKVADMNVDLWKRNDVADTSLKTIETVANHTRTEVQNGVRALIIQIGKLSGKSIMNNDKISMESLRKSVNLSLEKIITNQELFLESCHRVQMDESQIESEISGLLGKLIDMLEKKMTTVMKDIKSLEKTVKNHDSRTTRNIYQANNNIVSLFEKTTRSSETTEKELEEIKFYINSLFTLVQDVLPKSVGLNGTNELLLQHLSENITNLIKSTIVDTNIKWIELKNYFTNQSDISEKIKADIKNISIALLKTEADSHKTLSDKMNSFLQEMRNIDNKTINPPSNTAQDRSNRTIDLTSSFNSMVSIGKTNCTRNYGSLIDIRADGIDCNNGNNKDLTPNINEDADQPIFYDTNPNITEANTITDSTTTIRPEDDEELTKAILELFGTTPSSVTNTNATTEQTINKTGVAASKNKHNCTPAWANLLNIRADTNENGELCNETSSKLKKRKTKRRMKSRLNDDDSLEYADNTEVIDGFTEESSTTESLTESDLS